MRKFRRSSIMSLFGLLCALECSMLQFNKTWLIMYARRFHINNFFDMNVETSREAVRSLLLRLTSLFSAVPGRLWILNVRPLRNHAPVEVVKSYVPNHTLWSLAHEMWHHRLTWPNLVQMTSRLLPVTLSCFYPRHRRLSSDAKVARTPQTEYLYRRDPRCSFYFSCKILNFLGIAWFIAVAHLHQSFRQRQHRLRRIDYFFSNRHINGDIIFIAYALCRDVNINPAKAATMFPEM